MSFQKGFRKNYEHFLEHHRDRRSGEALKRLDNGLGHSELLFLETVWWPMYHDFSNLHPEYQVRDYNGGHRYIDFAYIATSLKIAIEVDGFGPHRKDMTSQQFTQECRRQNMLVIDQWHVLRFSTAHVQENPKLCQQTVEQLFGRFGRTAQDMAQLSVFEREIIRLATGATTPLTPQATANFLHISTKSAYRVLHDLTANHWLEPTGGKTRITRYQLHPSRIGTRL